MPNKMHAYMHIANCWLNYITSFLLVIQEISYLQTVNVFAIAYAYRITL